MTFKFNIKSKCLRAIVIILFVLIVLPLFIFLILAIIPMLIFSEYYSPRRLGGRKRVCLCLPICICDHLFWYYKGPNKCCRYISRLFISIPFWTVFTAISLTLAVVITAILIIPAWLLAIVSIIKMIIWWQKKDKKGSKNVVVEGQSTNCSDSNSAAPPAAPLTDQTTQALVDPLLGNDSEIHKNNNI